MAKIIGSPTRYIQGRGELANLAKHAGAIGETMFILVDKFVKPLVMPAIESGLEGKKIETGYKKFGAMLGDFVEVGCGTVLNPGTVIGKNTNVYPLSMVRGFVPANSIYKKQGEIASRR